MRCGKLQFPAAFLAMVLTFSSACATAEFCFTKPLLSPPGRSHQGWLLLLLHNYTLSSHRLCFLYSLIPNGIICSVIWAREPFHTLASLWVPGSIIRQTFILSFLGTRHQPATFSSPIFDTYKSCFWVRFLQLLTLHRSYHLISYHIMH